MRRRSARWILVVVVALVAQIVGLGVLRPAAASAQVPTIEVYLTVREYPYKCLGTNSSAELTPVVLGPCTTWEAVHLDGNMWAIRKPGTNRCLTVPYWRNYNAILYTCYGYGDQQWIPEYLVGGPLDLPALVRLRPQFSPNDCLIAPTWWSSAVLYDCLPFPDQEFWVTDA